MKTKILHRNLRVAMLAALVCQLPTARVLGTPGDLDPTFDGDGKLTLQVGTNAFTSDLSKAVFVQPDGKLVLAGDSNGRIAVIRLLSNGALDPNFGFGGIATTTLAEDDFFYVTGAALQSDGKILVVGQVTIATNATFGDVFVARYLTNGAHDPSFGTGGLMVHDLGFDDSGEGVVVQSDGRIVVAAYRYDFNLNQSLFGALRLLTNGALDSTFSGDGLAEAVFAGSDLAQPTALILQADGKIILAGHASFGISNRLALARIQTNGTLDASFGSGGVVTTSLGATNAMAASVFLQPDGRIVVTGNASFQFDGWLLAARYTTNGLPDGTFGAGGVVLVADAGGADGLVQPDGRILIAGTSSNDFGLFRLNADGSLDSGFGMGGRVQTTFSPGADGASALALQADGRVVVTGPAFINSSIVIAVARYLGDEPAPPTPVLAIMRGAPQQVTISWTPATPGFVLQERTNLTLGPWTNSPSGATNPVTVPATLPAKFYRLFKP
jgi:uncharacterized delta-60 repeat protein